MRNIVNEYIRMFGENRRARRKTAGGIAILALLVAVGVFWNLHFTGIALTGEVYYCGKEEHQHNEECYAWVLTDATDTADDKVTDGTLESGSGEATAETSGEISGTATEETTTQTTETASEEGATQTTGTASEEETTQTTETASEEGATQTTETASGEDITQNETAEEETEGTKAETETETEEETTQSADTVSEDETAESAGTVFTEEAESTEIETESEEEITFPDDTDTSASNGASLDSSTEESTAPATLGVSLDPDEETEELPEMVLCAEAAETEEWYLEHGYEKALICGKEEHIHTIDCILDETADVEAAEDWEATLPATLNGTAAENLVAVAVSQLGYTESIHNFSLADDGETKNGYTRYGAWYGNTYGEWNAMFVAFCLHYAGISEDDFPVNSGAYAWAAQLTAADLYASADGYTPSEGDLIFLDTDEDGKADLVGIVETVTVISELGLTMNGASDDSTEENINNTETAAFSLTVILGDYYDESDFEEETTADSVCRVEYTADDSAILGYGMLPDVEVNPPVYITMKDQTLTVTVDDLTVTLSGLLPVGATVTAEQVDLELEGQEIQFALEISIYDADGNEFEPKDGTITVTVASESITENCAVYYVPDKGNLEEITSESENGTATFEAEHFSVYVGITVKSKIAYASHMAMLAEYKEAAYSLNVGDDADAVEIAAYLKELLDAAKADLADGNLTQDEYDEIEAAVNKPLVWLDDNFDLSWTPDADEVDAVEEETEEEEPLTVEFTAEADGITVEASAAEGTFPEGTTMSVTLLSADNEETAQQYEEAVAAIEESGVEYEDDGLVLFDLSFFDEDGNEVEPEEGTVSVKVTMEASLVNEEVAEASSLELYHLKESDDGIEVETVADTYGVAGGTVDVDEDGTLLAEFSVENFSIFVVRVTDSSGGYAGKILYINAIDETFTDEFMGTDGNNIIVESSGDWESIENISINYIIKAAMLGYIYEYACPTRATETKITYVRQDQTTGEWYYWASSTVPSSTDTGELFYFNVDGNYNYYRGIYLVFSKYTSEESSDEEIIPSYSKYVSDNGNGTYDLTLTVSGDSTSDISGKVDIIYILDVSRSMAQELSSTEQGITDRYERLEAANAAIVELTKAISSDETIDAKFSTVIFAASDPGSIEKNEENDKKFAEYYTVLYGDNDGTYNDAVVLQSWTNSATQLIGSLPTAVDMDVSVSVNTGLGHGTNYQAGLYSSETLLKSTRPDATTVVIFVSDGNASAYYDVDGWTVGTGGSSYENAKASLNAAIPQLESMYRSGYIDYFMTVGVGPTDSYTNLVKLGYLLEYDTVYNSSEADTYAETIKNTYGVNVSFFAGSDQDSLNTAFDKVLETIQNITGITDVTISDTLSENVTAVLNNLTGNVTLTITAENANGTSYSTVITTAAASGSLKLEDGTVIKASYDADEKTITLDFPDDYELVKGWTYSVTLLIEATEKAYDNYYDTGGYPDVGDTETDAPNVAKDDYISSGKGGVYTNATTTDEDTGETTTTATLYYTYYGSEKTKLYKQPVIPLYFEQLTIQKYDEDGSTLLAGAAFILSRENSDGETVYYSYNESTGKTSWVSSSDDATVLTSSDSNGDYQKITLYNLFALRSSGETYYLQETKAPEGYDELDGTVKFYLWISNWTNNKLTYKLTLIGSHKNVTVDDTVLQLLITNEKIYYALPSTGGSGTILYTGSGLTLLFGAAWVMYRQKRRGRERIRSG